MSNQWCHVCGGLVDRIGLQPTGFRLCGCTRTVLKYEKKRASERARVEELKDTIDSAANAATLEIERLKAERDRLRDLLKATSGVLERSVADPSLLLSPSNRAIALELTSRAAQEEGE